LWKPTGIGTQSRMQRFTSLIGRATGAKTQGEALHAARECSCIKD
jgi:hypothetical protein